MPNKEKAIKILLTGEPGVGKSTLVQKVVAELTIPVSGIVAKEIRDSQHNRVGFEAVNFKGERRTFAHKTDIQSSLCVGGKYFVDLDAIENFVVPEISSELANTGVMIIDEIGRMQAFSQVFLDTVAELLENQTAVLGTIVKDPESWSIEFKEHHNVVLVQVTTENRNEIADVLTTMYNQLDYLQQLSSDQKAMVFDLTKAYFKDEKYLLIKKLFGNALVYLVEGRILEVEPVEVESTDGVRVFEVEGNHGKHRVRCIDGECECDCNLFLGKDEYAGQAGECSHIQITKLYMIS